MVVIIVLIVIVFMFSDWSLNLVVFLSVWNLLEEEFSSYERKWKLKLKTYIYKNILAHLMFGQSIMFIQSEQ